MQYTDPSGHANKKGSEGPLCAPNHSGCQPFSDRVWTVTEIQKLIDSLKGVRDELTGLIAIAALFAMSGTPVVIVSGAIFAWEFYQVDTLIDYLEGAKAVAEKSGDVRISFYTHESEYGGAFVIINYQGASTYFVTTSILLEMVFDPRLSWYK